MSHDNDESYLTRRLLTPPTSPPISETMQKVRIENEKSDNKVKMGSDKEPDFRLHDAVCDTENIQEVEDLLEENPNLLFERDDEGRTPLHTLTISGDEEAPEVVKVLLGVTESSDGNFIVQTERAKALHTTDDKGFTPLHYAARNWWPALTRLLLQCGARPDAQDAKGDTPLHLAAEGNIDGALECASEILKHDWDGTLLNLKNVDEHTALHRAVKEQGVEMVNLLLQHKLDLSAHWVSKGQSILQYLCIESGETDKSCQIFASIATVCSPGQLNFSDEEGRTVLHTAAIKRLPRIVDILVADERLDVLKIDKRKRNALHYAAENGAYPDGYGCVEGLINRRFPRTKVQIQYLYEMSDEMGSSPFMLACLNCPVDTMRKYLRAIREPQFWMSDTNMTLVYKQCPMAIGALMDGAFSERKNPKDAEVDVIVSDFGPITGYADPIETLPQQETKYLKNALWWDYETQKEILMHPLVQLFVVKKCQKLRAIIYGWILWQLIWLAAYTMLALTTYCNVINSPPTGLVAAIIIGIYIMISLINEVFEVSSVGLAYVRSISNYFQIVQVILASVAIYPVLLAMEVTVVNKNCAAIGVLLAYILSMRDIGKMHEEIALVVEVLKQVVIQIIKVLLCCSPILFGFTLAFVILFEDDESLNTTFPGPLVKVLVMMTGEFEYNDTFKTEEGEGGGKPGGEVDTKNRAIRLLVFLSFLICIPVSFFNLLTAFALERVMELRERAKVGRIAKQLEHIYFIESILLSLSPLKKLVLPHGKLARLLRKYNVTTAMIDGDLKFETFISEQTPKKIDRRTAKEKSLDLCAVLRSIFGTELSPEVRREIFAMASQQSKK